MIASILRKLTLPFWLVLLTACSPAFDWREVRNEEFGYLIMMPARPTTVTRDINLDGAIIRMSMTATEVDKLTFAVGSATIPAPNNPQTALESMKTALIRNIRGTIIEESTFTMPHTINGQKRLLAVLYVHAKGTAIDNQPRTLQARFVAQGNRVYQIVMTGPEEKMTRDVSDIYFSSLQLN
ncbi:MAG: hypothetical protein REI95_04940 [Oxalicibacterium faecigallinarum]|uniref:hypothetical protein n=1 Tax=Oxalicibacterium faecigallinarum TaxID=573741 RepID=UPI002808303C|nr:hypothetical protein [Oxalicibacterium faecigallinarum]MDQ7968970.1 hypothetical protein [Oxalicibacterium faecigallinarum]